MILKEKVLHIAKLARLELSEQELLKMQKDLSEILDYFELLKKAPKLKIDKIEAKEAFLRRDESEKSYLSDEIIASFPDKKDNCIKVKTIL